MGNFQCGNIEVILQEDFSCFSYDGYIGVFFFVILQGHFIFKGQYFINKGIQIF